MIRRALAGSPDIALGAVALDWQPALAVVPDPPVAHAGVTLEPAVTITPGLPDADAGAAVDVDLRPIADVVAVAMVENLFALRRADLRLAVPDDRTMPLLACETSGAPARIAEPAVARADPPWLAVIERAPTPPGSVPKAELRTMLTALFRASGLAAPTDLSLVGIYRRAPGGAIRAVSMAGDRIQLRVDPRVRARPATLIVGRDRTGGNLVTAEL
jgi:hypothetical protein